MTFVDACRNSDVVSHNLLFPLCLYGFSDLNSQLKNKAELLMRRLDKVDLNESALISQLYVLFLGSPGNTPAQKKKVPANDAQRLLILDQFLKSKVACNSFPLTLQLIYECLFGMFYSLLLVNPAGVMTTVRIQLSGLRFLDWVLRLGEDKQLGHMGPLLLSGLKKILAQNNLERMHYFCIFTYVRRGRASKGVGLRSTWSARKTASFYLLE
jgi:hypothetical protein